MHPSRRRPSTAGRRGLWGPLLLHEGMAMHPGRRRPSTAGRRGLWGPLLLHEGMAMHPGRRRPSTAGRRGLFDPSRCGPALPVVPARMAVHPSRRRRAGAGLRARSRCILPVPARMAGTCNASRILDLPPPGQGPASSSDKMSLNGGRASEHRRMIPPEGVDGGRFLRPRSRRPSRRRRHRSPLLPELLDPPPGRRARRRSAASRVLRPLAAAFPVAFLHAEAGRPSFAPLMTPPRRRPAAPAPAPRGPRHRRPSAMSTGSNRPAIPPPAP